MKFLQSRGSFHGCSAAHLPVSNMAGHTLAAFPESKVAADVLLKHRWERRRKLPRGHSPKATPRLPRDARRRHKPPSKGAILEPKWLSLSLLLTRIRGELGPPGTEARPPLRAFEGVKFSLSLFLPSFHWGQVRKRTRAKDPPFPLFWWNRALGSTAGFAAVGRCSWWIASVVLSLSLGHKCSVSDPGLQPHPCCWRDQGREKTNNHEKE